MFQNTVVFTVYARNEKEKSYILVGVILGTL